jgi:uncharacterized membrane protein
MFVIFYTKATSEILNFRHDLSVPANPIEQLVNTFLSDNNATANSVGYAEVPQQNFVDFHAGKYLYNASTKTISDNPAFVPPTPAPDPTPAT